MNSAICIDFGTSSIRAAFRDIDEQLHVIPLGQLAGERRLDGASLMSEIFVDRRKCSLAFGETAFMLSRGNQQEAYSKSSAKLWLKDPGMLSQIEVQELELTREHLLVGLLAYALVVTSRANLKVVLKGHVRVAHPIWEQEKQKESNLALLRITDKAIALAESGFQNPLPAAALQRVAKMTISVEPGSRSVDVIEPIAAAQQLIPYQENLRRIVAVIDVGAGTTDIGLFTCKEPDVRGGTKLSQSAIVPLTSARSLMKAGDLVDQTLLRLLFGKAQRLTMEDKREAEAEIRRLKEQLFKEGKLAYQGCTIERKELERNDDLQGFAREVRANLEQMIFEKLPEVKSTTVSKSFQVPYVEVIMAGGGAGLSFLVEKLRGPLQVGDIKLELKVVMPVPTGQKQYEADIGRLAVALGGVNAAYDDLRKEYEVERRTGSTLGSPKQEISEQGRDAAGASAQYRDAQLWWGSQTDSPMQASAPQVGSSVTPPVQSTFSFATVANPQIKAKVIQQDAKAKWTSTWAKLLEAAKSKESAHVFKFALHLLSAPTEELKRMHHQSAIDRLLSLAQNDHPEAAFQLALHHSDKFKRCYFLQLWKSYHLDHHREEAIRLENEISNQLTPAEIVKCTRECNEWVTFRRGQKSTRHSIYQSRSDARKQDTGISKQVDSDEQFLRKFERLRSKYKK